MGGVPPATFVMIPVIFYHGRTLFSEYFLNLFAQLHTSLVVASCDDYLTESICMSVSAWAMGVTCA